MVAASVTLGTLHFSNWSPLAWCWWIHYQELFNWGPSLWYFTLGAVAMYKYLLVYLQRLDASDMTCSPFWCVHRSGKRRGLGVRGRKGISPKYWRALALPECPGTLGLSVVNTAFSFLLRASGCLWLCHPFAWSFEVALWFLNLLIAQ